MTDEDFSIFGEICESAAFRNKSDFKKYNVKELKELIYLYFLALAVFENVQSTSRYGKSYAANAAKFNGFDDFKSSANDLYVMIHAVFGKNNDQIAKNIKGSLGKEFINEGRIIRWLRNVGKHSSKDNQRFLMEHERKLNIKNSDLKNIRRVISNWDSSSVSNKKNALSRMSQMLRSRASKSEIISAINRIQPESKISHARQFATALALGTAIVGGATAYSLHKASKDRSTNTSILRNSLNRKNNLEENVSGAVSGAGAIAAIPMPIGKKKTKVKKRNSKYGNALYQGKT